MTSEFAGTERFHLVRLLGAGGMGRVYEASDRVGGARVALKLLSHFGARHLYQFKQEFRMLADAVHPNLVGLHELHSDGEHWFFSMDLVDGVDFSAFVRGISGNRLEDPRMEDTVAASTLGRVGEDRPDSPQPPAGGSLDHEGLDVLGEVRLRTALAGLVSGVAALHEAGIVHRDLKPSNVLVTEDGRAVILDFGLVSPKGGDAGGTHDIVSGTIPYMSPEQAEGGPVGAASDWYSVGVMIFEVLAGRLPFQGSYSQILAAKRSAGKTWKPEFSGRVPDDLADLCLRLLSANPEARPNDREMLALLGARPVTGVQTTVLDVESSVPLLGRERHLAELDEALEKVKQGGCVVAWVQGRSGMGKSALLRTFLRRAGERGALVLSGRCHPSESVPFKGIDAVVDRLATYLEALPEGDVMALMPRHLAALTQLFPVLAIGERGTELAGRQSGVTDPQENRRRAFVALRDLLCRLGDREDLVLAVDDLQWGDLDGAMLLGELVRSPDAPSMLLLLSHRSDEGAGGEALAAFRTSVGQHVPPERTSAIEVGPLAMKEAEEMARICCRDYGDSSEERAAFVAREARGIPFFIEELSRAPARRGEGEAAGVSLDEYTRERVRGLPAAARRLLEVLAVAGRPLPQSLAWRAAGSASIHLEALKLLQGLHLVRTQGMGERDPVECYHDRIREALAAGLAEEDARACHLALAMCWEGWPARNNEAVAHHYLHAGHGERAASFARRAAGEAASALAFGRAAELYRMSLEHGQWGDEDVRALLAGLGDVLAAAGRGKEAAEVYLDAAGRSTGEGKWRFQEKAAEQLLATGHSDRGREVLGQVLSRFGLSIPSSTAATLWSLAWLGLRKWLAGTKFVARPASEIAPEVLDRIDVCRSAAVNMGMGDPMRSAVFQQRGLVLALKAGEPGRVARQLASEGAYAAAFGGKGYARSIQLIGAAMRLAASNGDPLALATCHACLAIALFQQGKWAESVRQAREGERICTENSLHARWEMHTCRLFQVGPVGWMGRYTEYGALASELLADADARQDRYTAGHVRLGAPISTALLDDLPQRCADSIEAENAVLASGDLTLYHVYSMRAQCQLALYQGDARNALALASDLDTRLRRSLLARVAIARNFALESLGCALLASSGAVLESRVVLARLGRCIRSARRVGLTWLDGLADQWEAGACVLAGERAGAIRKLEEATIRYEHGDMQGHAAACRFRKGSLEGGEAGRELQIAALRALRNEQVVNPERLMDILAPMPS